MITNISSLNGQKSLEGKIKNYFNIFSQRVGSADLSYESVQKRVESFNEL
jgi:hypothetical protein